MPGRVPFNWHMTPLEAVRHLRAQGHSLRTISQRKLVVVPKLLPSGGIRWATPGESTIHDALRLDAQNRPQAGDPP